MLNALRFASATTLTVGPPLMMQLKLCATVDPSCCGTDEKSKGICMDGGEGKNVTSEETSQKDGDIPSVEW